MGLPRSWVIGGSIYASVIVLALLLRLLAWDVLPGGLYAVVVLVSDYGTLPPFLAGVGIYVGLDVSLSVQSVTGLHDSDPILVWLAWSPTVVGAALVAVANVYLVYGLYRFALRSRRCWCRRSPQVLG
jgi:hypothetical protein